MATKGRLWPKLISENYNVLYNWGSHPLKVKKIKVTLTVVHKWCSLTQHFLRHYRCLERVISEFLVITDTGVTHDAFMH